MSDTKIEWTDVTWNPIRGCSVISPGCVNCYAMKQAHRFSGKGKAYEGLTKQTSAGPQWTGEVMLAENHLLDPLRWRAPKRVFVNSMSDLFHDRVPFEFIAAVFAVMAYCDRHTFQVLTKRAHRMREFMGWVNAPEGYERLTNLGGEAIKMARMHRVDQDVATHVWGYDDSGVDLDACLHNNGVWPPKNVWLGVSVENQKYADERIPLLLQTPAAVKFISYEPALGPVDFTDVATDTGPINALWSYTRRDAPAPWSRLDWVIVGGESGPGARPFEVAWARSVVQQCAEGGVPVFVKQMGSHPIAERPDDFPRYALIDDGTLRLRDKKGGDLAEWPEDLRVRQFPEGRR